MGRGRLALVVLFSVSKVTGGAAYLIIYCKYDASSCRAAPRCSRKTHDKSIFAIGCSGEQPYTMQPSISVLQHRFHLSRHHLISVLLLFSDHAEEGVLVDDGDIERGGFLEFGWTHILTGEHHVGLFGYGAYVLASVLLDQRLVLVA